MIDNQELIIFTDEDCIKIYHQDQKKFESFDYVQVFNELHQEGESVDIKDVLIDCSVETLKYTTFDPNITKYGNLVFLQDESAIQCCYNTTERKLMTFQDKSK